MMLLSSHVSLPASLESPHVVLQTCLEVAVPPEQLNPHSILHPAEQPSPAAVLLSSQKFAVLVSVPTVLPSPHIVEQTDASHVKLLVHTHPDSTRQLALHPSLLLVLPSSHVSLPARLESPHVVLQTCLEVAVPPEQVYPHSTVHPTEQPSPAAVLLSSQKPAVFLSAPSVLPSPQSSLPVFQRHWEAAQLPLLLLQV
jgi:hypothetical protein